MLQSSQENPAQFRKQPHSPLLLLPFLKNASFALTTFFPLHTEVFIILQEPTQVSVPLAHLPGCGPPTSSWALLSCSRPNILTFLASNSHWTITIGPVPCDTCVHLCVCWEGTWASQVASAKESACNAGDAGSIPGSGRSPGCRNGNPLQYPCLGNPVGRGAWWAAVHGVVKSPTWLNMSMMESMRARARAHTHTHTHTHTQSLLYPRT